MESLCFNPRFPASARVVLAGPNNSGKSHLLQRILRFRQEVCSPQHPKADDVLLYFYLIDEPETHMELRKIFPVAEFHKGIDSLREVLGKYEEIAKTADVYLVIEDLMLTGAKSNALSEVFLAYAHHMPICASFFTLQSLYQRNSHLGMMLRNATNLIFTGSSRLKSSLAYYGRELDPRRPLELLSVFEACLSARNDADLHPYLVVNCLSQDTKSGMY